MEEAGFGEELTDLAIVGGGPAGSAAALEARRRGLRVAMWEREKFPRDKVCGEFLSAESLPILEKEIPGELARAAAIRTSEFISPRGRVHAFRLPRAARGLSRSTLDHALWRAAASRGAEVFEGDAVAELSRIDATGNNHGVESGWKLKTARGKARAALAVLITCGRWWSIEGFPSPARESSPNGRSQWLGLKAHFSGVPYRDVVELYFFRGGYCGLAPIEEGLYNACCLVSRELLGASGVSDFASWLKTTSRHCALEARLKGATQDSETVATAPLAPGRARAERQGVLFAGDAAGFLDPFTGDGISMALHGGRLAAEIIASGLGEGSGKASAHESPRLYRRRLASALRRSYALAGLFRLLVHAPEAVQDGAASLLPWFGSRLHAETRWRETEGE